MILDRMTPCSKIQIKVPRWKERTIGIAKFRVSTHNEIEILSTRPDGTRHYPDKYYISGEAVRACPTQTLKASGIILYLVPINSLEPLERSK